MVDIRKKKIGVIAYDFPPKVGGMENYSENLTKQFIEYGYDINLFIPINGDPLPGATNHCILTGNLLKDIPKLRKFEMDLWLSTNSSYCVLASIKKNFFVCVHGNDFLVPWVRYKLPWMKKLFIWRFKKSIEQGIFNFKRKRALKRVAGILANSSFTKEKFLSIYPELREKVKVITPGVEEYYFTDIKKRNNKGKFHLMTVARLSSVRKNIHSVINALAELKDSYAFKYYIFGDGDVHCDLYDLIIEKNLDKQVFLMGRVSKEMLKEHYEKSDLFILVPKTSVDDVEGFGIVYLEANASGTPVLTSRGNGSIDAVVEGVNGFFVNNPTVPEIKKAIADYFDNQLQFQPQKAVEHARKFLWKNIAMEFLKAFEVKENGKEKRQYHQRDISNV